MEYTVYYTMAKDYIACVDADSPQEAVKSIINQFDKDGTWDFDDMVEPSVMQAWVENDDNKVLMEVNAWEENPIDIIRKLAEVKPKEEE